MANIDAQSQIVNERSVRQYADIQNMNFSDNDALGKIVWLMGHSDHHNIYRVNDLFELIIPPIASQQFRIWEGKSHPDGFMTWAWLSDEDSEEYQKGNKDIDRYDFAGGNNLWIIDMVMPFNNTKSLLSEGKQYLTNLYGKGTVLRGRRTKNNLFKRVIL